MAAWVVSVVGAVLLAGSATAATVPWNAFNRQWGTGFEDLATAVSVNASGIYVVGHTRGTLPGQISAGNWDPFVRRYDANGNEIWTRQFGATDFASFDIANAVATAPGAVYVVGAVFGTLPGQTRTGSFDAFVRKYAEAGAELWTHQFGGAQVPFVSSDDSANGVAVDSSGVYVVGDTSAILDGQVNEGGTDAFIRKYAHDGSLLWTRQFGTAEDEAGASVATDGTGVYLVGDTLGVLPGQTKTSPEKEAFVRKYDPDGNELWTRQFATGSVNIARPRATTVTVYSGTVYIGGFSGGIMPGSSSAGGYFIRTYAADGAELWTRQSTGSPEFASRTASLAVDATGISFVSAARGTLPGQTEGLGDRALVRRYDLDGNERWTRQFVQGAANGVVADASGIYIVGEAVRPLPDHAQPVEEDAFLVKVFETADVDDTPPGLSCRLPSPTYFLNAPITQAAPVSATIMDVDSGPLTGDVVVRAQTSPVGQHTSTLTAMDWAGNLGTVSCPYTISYRFSFSPLTAVPPAVNTSEAKGTVPLGWVVSDALNRRVIDPTHFLGLTAREVPCDAGAPTSPIDPAVEPSSGLALLPDRSWQYGWAAEKEKKDTCHELTVQLADTVPGRVALFALTKKDKGTE